MKILSLRASNFLTLGDTGVIGLADRGLNLILGENRDDTSAESNGSGKSSIPDALCWALFGVTARGESGDTVVNDKKKKDCVVSVELEEGAVKYRVTRHRKHATHKNALLLEVQDASGIQPLTKGTDKETQLVVEEVLGCTYEVFKAAIYAGQEEMPDLPKMTDKPLKMLIEEAAGVQQLERAYAIANAEATTAERKVATSTTMIQGAQNAVQAGAVAIERTKISQGEFEAGRAARAQVHVDRAAQLTAQAREIGAKLQGVDQAKLQEERRQIAEKTAGYHAARAELSELEGKPLQQAQRKVYDATRDFETHKASALQLRADHDSADTAVKRSCSACGRPHDDTMTPDAYRAHVLPRLQDAVERAKKAGELVALANQEYDALQDQIAAKRAAIPDVTALLERDRQISEGLVAIERATGQVRALVTEVQSQTAQAETVRKQPNPYDPVLANQQADLERFQKQVDDMQAQHIKTVEDYEVAMAVAKVYSPAGVRARILDEVTPFLNERTAHYLGTLSDGNISATWSTLSRTAKGELREKFCIDVGHAKGGKTFKLLSGGEKRKVRLATMMALQDLVASRATKPIQLWIGDEIDDAMDPAGLERLMTLLEQRARERGTVLIISHNDLADWCDSTTTIIKEVGGISRIEGALAGH